MWFFYSFSFVPLIAKYEVNQMIQKHDVQKIKQVAADQKTAAFFLKLKKSARCDAVGDFQGGSANVGYYPADINGKDIAIDMRKKTWFYWQIDKIYYYPKEDH